MYHEKTLTDLKRGRRLRVVLLLAAALVAALLVGVLGRLREAQLEQGAAAMRQSILSAATRCAAVEGSYPQSLQYLEERYGLRVNHQDYVVTYEAFASNVLPSVVVRPR